MCDSTLAIYCFVDDFLKASGHREDIQAEVSDAEVITTAICAMLHFGGNFERSRLCLYELGMIKRLLTSKRRYFYSVRVQLMATSGGIPLEFRILPSGCADLQGLAELPLDLPETAEVFVDAGYNFYVWEDYLREVKHLSLQVPRKANSKRAREPWLEAYKSLVRKYIETTIGEITKLFTKKIHATNLNGFLLKIALFLFVYQVNKTFI